MDPFREKMICQICPDKRKIAMATNDTKRITNGLMRFFDFSRVRNAKTTPVLFHEPVRCQYTANSCGGFKTRSRELSVLEEKLKEVFDGLYVHIQSLCESGDKEKARSISYQANQLLRGHYL